MSAHKQPPMFDSDIVIDAIEGICHKTTDTACAAFELLKSCERFCISAVTTFELMHTENPEQRRIFGQLSLEEHALTRQISNLAADIANHARIEGMICEKCWAMLPTRTCKHCNGQVARQQRINDILIAATAEVHRVPTLYARDGGMIELGKLGKFFQNTQIILPPPAPRQVPLLPDNTVRLDQKKRQKS